MTIVKTILNNRFIAGLDPVVKSLMATASDQAKKHQVLYKREFQKIGQCFGALGNALEVDDLGRARGRLNQALKDTGEAYNEIGRLYEEQPKYDWEPLADKFHIYRGIISSFPDVISIHKV
jgi:sorting nexin-9/18/33